MEISWPHVRQVILNDRVNGYKPDRSCIDKLARMLPDVRVLGFGKYYEFHWYVILESRYFPASMELLSMRGAQPLSGIIKDLANRIPIG